MIESGGNAKKLPLLVSHADLERVSESLYRSRCPACSKGVLFVHRSQATLELINVDRCTYCGQLVVYTDKFIADEPVLDVHHTGNT